MEHDGDTALVAYNYNSMDGHNASWMVSGSGGPVSITSRCGVDRRSLRCQAMLVGCRGELGECDFEQENDLTLRTDVRSHPIETGLNGAIRIHYLTDNVDFRSVRS